MDDDHVTLVRLLAAWERERNRETYDALAGKQSEYRHECPDCEVRFTVEWDREDMAPLQYCPYCGYKLQ